MDRDARPRWTRAATLLAAGALAMAACAGPRPAPSTPPPVVETTVPATPAPEGGDECYDCHTDRQRIIDNLEPEAPVKAESSGEG